MQKKLENQEETLKQVYNSVFNELSKLQIEEKFLERQAQSLIENMISKHGESPELLEAIQNIIEENDQDFIMQDMHIENLKQEGVVEDLSQQVRQILEKNNIDMEPESYAFPSKVLKRDF
ncbi:unnamed protein product [Blepharisma stoltei]|uniref:Uncharacterized protein n=1 Tax=Blepharisma stoltei TaxID=1481888 RepID=A0AAU9JBV3_9CILI|nr:unnamed protein product [Blepharisma stoltei]